MSVERLREDQKRRRSDKEMLVQDMATVEDWLKRHFGEYDAYEIKFRKASEIKQGREP